MKILILALSGIGDALMFTPAITLIKNEYPSFQIDALVMFKGVKDIYERIDAIDNVLHFDFMKEGKTASLKYVVSLRNKYDVTVNVYPSNRKEYNVINYLIGAKIRGGVEYLRKDSSNLGWLNNARILENDQTHNVQTNLKLVTKLFNLSSTEEPDLDFPLNKEDYSYAESFLEKNNINEDDNVVGFHPGCATLKNHIKRRWEPEKFSELGSLLIEKNNCKVLIFGGPEEKELKEQVADKINSDNKVVVNTENLAQTAAIMKRCNLFVTNDSSLMHIASAMKLKVVALIGPTNPHYIHPWKTEHKIISLNLDCAPCFVYSPRPLVCFRDDVKFKCIKELSVEFAYNQISSYI